VPHYTRDGRLIVPVKDFVEAGHKYFYENRIRMPRDLLYKDQFEHKLRNFVRKKMKSSQTISHTNRPAR
jgi:hypothetical protein